jgi:sialic acid synthase SpsE
MSVRLIAELGSCHMGKLERIIEAINICKETRIDALKLQLFPNTAPYVPTNVYLPFEMFLEAKRYGDEIGVPVSASVFDEESFRKLLVCQPKFIKFAYGKKDQQDWIRTSLTAGIETIVSCDVMTDHAVPEKVTKLYCIPEYPVRYEVNFDELFPRFDGFSDHTLGLRQTKRAIEAGAQIIEKHVRLGYEDETCPDAFFAVNIGEFAKCRT